MKNRNKMLTKTPNLIPMIYFYFNFTSLNPSATFRNNGKINLDQPTKHHLPPEIFLISASVHPALPVAWDSRSPSPQPPKAPFFNFLTCSRQRSSDQSVRATDTPHLSLLNGDDAREELLSKTPLVFFSFYLMHISLPAERVRWNWRHLFMVWKKNLQVSRTKGKNKPQLCR